LRRWRTGEQAVRERALPNPMADRCIAVALDTR
jgi:hypothetical protein